MTFNKSRVYTALNADEVKVGSKGVFADNVDWLKHFVKDERHISTVEKIESENMVYRFRNIKGDNYQLFYLWEEPEEKKYRPYKDTEEMIADYKKHFYVDNTNYTMPLIWVKEKVNDNPMLITAFGAGNNRIYNHNHWINLKELLIYYTYLDGSPCGILEK